MNWHNSQIHHAHVFRRVFISQRHSSPITRAQVIFLSFLIDSVLPPSFTCRSVLIPGMSFELCNQYLHKLERIGYAVKSGRYWTITPAGRDYYRLFMQEFNRVMNEPLKWR